MTKLNMKILVLTGILSLSLVMSSIPLADAAPTVGRTLKSPGVMMMFCGNDAWHPNDCDERYEGYSWSERIVVLIYAPGWNEDSRKVDSIGTTEFPIDVYTDAQRISDIDFQETGPDTGIFKGTIKMTGQGMNSPCGMMCTVNKVHDNSQTTVKTMGMGGEGSLSSHDIAAKIQTNAQDGRITVAWEANEDINLVKSASYSWRVGELGLIDETVEVNTSLTGVQPNKLRFYVHDADLWTMHHEPNSYWVEVWSDSDHAGTWAQMRFVENHDHGEGAYVEEFEPLTEPASHSLQKYTPDGLYKIYMWWEPGGAIGVGQNYLMNFMIHDGMTDVHQQGISYDMDVILNGEIIETRTDRFSVDGNLRENVSFTERGSAKISIYNINGYDTGEDFSFQVAPTPEIREVAPRHHAFDDAIDPLYDGYEHIHFIDTLIGEIELTTDDRSFGKGQLRVNPGDNIYIQYTDQTLPNPYDQDEEMELIITAQVVGY